MLYYILNSSVLLLIALISISCVGIRNSSSGSPKDNPYSVTNEKWRLWQVTKPNDATTLKTSIRYSLGHHNGVGYPAAFSISNDGSLYLSDNSRMSLEMIRYQI